MLATSEMIQEATQHSRLEELLPEWQQVPLYRRFLSQRPPGANIVDVLPTFPFTGKREMREGFPFLPPGQSLERLLEQDVVELEHTSGTSEEQLPVLFRRGWWDTQEERALRLNPFVARILDANPEARRVTLTTPACSGRVCFSAWRSREHRTIGRTLYVNQWRIPFILEEDNLARMAEEIADWAPTFLDTDPVHAAWFALYCERKGIRFPSLKFILCSYEFVSAAHRRILRRVFGVPVFNLYGSTETGHLLMESFDAGNRTRVEATNSSADFQVCRIAGFQARKPSALGTPADLEIGDTAGLETCATSGQGKMKPSYDNAFLEVIEPDARNVGDLVVTTLTNDYMPLLRYRIGDLVERREGPYDTIYTVHGRARDALRAGDGSRVTTWDVDQCLEGVEGMAHYQLHQDKDAGCRLRFVPDANVGGPQANDLKDAIARLENLLQPKSTIEVEAVTMLPPTTSGKFRLTVRE